MSRVIKISAVVIAFNEERNIGRCLDSLTGVADEVVVVDSYSTDKTRSICQSKGVRFIRHRFEGHIEQKNYAMQQAGYNHILSLDADEVLSDRLKKSIVAEKNNWGYDAYTLNRLTNYCGRWIKHCGWYPDTKIRLWDRRKGRWGGENPHDKVLMDDNIPSGHLQGDLLHFSYHNISDHIAQINSFSEIAARAAYKKSRPPNLVFDILLNPFFTFFKKYVLKLGVLDGYSGFLISIHTAYGKFLKYIKLKEMYKNKNEKG